MSLESNAAYDDYLRKHRKLTVRFSITGNATPANVTHSTDLETVYVSTEGNTADSVDSGMNVAEDDGATNSVFGLLVTELGSVEKVLKATVTDLGAETGGSDTSTATPVTFAGASNTGITASGNVALSVAGTGLDIGAPENFTGVLELELLLSK